MKRGVSRRERPSRQSQSGQIMVLFTLTLVFVLVLATGLVIDGGNAFVQRRVAQNAADFAAVAGTQYVMADAVATSNGTSRPYQDVDIRNAIESSLQVNGLSTTTYTAQYVDSSGNPITPGTVGSIGGGVVPDSARGVRVNPTKRFATSLLSRIGITSWDASASATARGAYTPGLTVPAGDLLPIAVDYADYLTHTKCPYGVAATDPSCAGSRLDLATGTGSGNHGWMAWTGFSGNVGDLVDMLTPPVPAPVETIPDNGHGSILIDGNTGNSNSIQVRNAIAALVASGATYWIPLFSPGPPGTFPDGTPYPPPSVGTGNNQRLNIIGFAGFQLTGCPSNPCTGSLQGVLRVASFLGPTGTTSDVFVPGSSIAISLVR